MHESLIYNHERGHGSVRVLSMIKKLHEACLFLCLLLLLQLVGLVWASKHRHCGCFPITAIKGLHCYAVCPSSVKWHRSTSPARFCVGKGKIFKLKKQDLSFHLFHPSVRTMPSSTDLLGRARRCWAFSLGPYTTYTNTRLWLEAHSPNRWPISCSPRSRTAEGDSKCSWVEAQSSLTKADRPVESSWLQKYWNQNLLSVVPSLRITRVTCLVFFS